MLTEKDLIDGQRWLACWEKDQQCPFIALKYSTTFEKFNYTCTCTNQPKGTK